MVEFVVAIDEARVRFTVGAKRISVLFLSFFFFFFFCCYHLFVHRVHQLFLSYCTLIGSRVRTTHACRMITLELSLILYDQPMVSQSPALECPKANFKSNLNGPFFFFFFLKAEFSIKASMPHMIVIYKVHRCTVQGVWYGPVWHRMENTQDLASG